ncbi:MAG: hypothetical protein A2096_13905 [Spirochaetes bacterium GWF1_41_5]|nr:MAG: hypothetical protein A2096_13905 [Spirochaetes bacterium GWF1_41_5]HBE02466.1 hypothetical protein [Spirochaetia bacterium]
MKPVITGFALMLMLIPVFCPAKFLFIENKYLRIGVDDITGRFNMYQIASNSSGKKEYKEILFPKFPFNSYTSIYIDGWVYIFGSDLGAKKFARENEKIITTWALEEITVYQDIYFQANPVDQMQDMIAVGYRIKNTGREIRNIGVRIMLDLMLGSEADPSFGTESEKDINFEKQYKGREMPNFWYSYGKTGEVKIQGFLQGGELTRPDSLVFSSSRKLYSNPWHYQDKSGREFKRFFLGVGDSGAALYYSPKEIPPEESREFKTYLGILKGFTLESEITESAAEANKVVIEEIEEEKENIDEYIQKRKEELIQKYLQECRQAFTRNEFPDALDKAEYILSLDSANSEGRELWVKSLTQLYLVNKSEILRNANISKKIFQDAVSAYETGKYQDSAALFNQYIDREGPGENADYFSRLIKAKNRMETLKAFDPKDPNYETFLKLKRAAELAWQNKQYIIGARYLLKIFELSPFNAIAINYMKTYIKQLDQNTQIQLAQILEKAGTEAQASSREFANGYFLLLKEFLPGYKTQEITALIGKTDAFSPLSTDEAARKNAVNIINQGINLFEKQKKQAEGLEMVKKGLDLYPQFIEARKRFNIYELTVKYLGGFNDSKYQEDIKRASLKNISIKEFSLRAEACYEKRDYTQAKKIYENILAIDPENQAAIKNIETISALQKNN